MAKGTKRSKAWRAEGSKKGRKRPTTGNYSLADKPKASVSLPKLRFLEVVHDRDKEIAFLKALGN